MLEYLYLFHLPKEMKDFYNVSLWHQRKKNQRKSQTIEIPPILLILWKWHPIKNCLRVEYNLSIHSNWKNSVKYYQESQTPSIFKAKAGGISTPDVKLVIVF